MTVHTMRFLKSALWLLMTANVPTWHRTAALSPKSTRQLLMTAYVLIWHRTEAMTSMRTNESLTPQNASVWQQHMAHMACEVRCATLSVTTPINLTCLRPHYDKDVPTLITQHDRLHLFENVNKCTLTLMNELQCFFKMSQCTRRSPPSLGSTQCLSIGEVSENPDYGRGHNDMSSISVFVFECCFFSQAVGWRVTHLAVTIHHALVMDFKYECPEPD